MFDSFKIHSYRHDYTIHFIKDYISALKDQISGREVLLIDKGVFKLYKDIVGILEIQRVILVDANEDTKSFQALEAPIDRLLSMGISKTDHLIAIGGGVTQDVTSFIASILFRGIPWIYFPTNLLSQADSCIGSKNSINFKSFKNQLGNFYPPTKIYISPEFLKTLSEKDILSGLGEMMHYFCVSGKDDFLWAKEIYTNAGWKKDGFGPLIQKSLSIKKQMIEIDEFDAGPRNVFNYGHSFGHALETATNYSLPHGVAVCYGMDLANCISVKLGHVSKVFRNNVREALTHIWGKSNLHLDELATFFLSLGRDKKNEGNDIKVILTRGFGDMFKTTLEINNDTKQFIADYFNNKQWENNI